MKSKKNGIYPVQLSLSLWITLAFVLVEAAAGLFATALRC
jgi:hypothetical protein